MYLSYLNNFNNSDCFIFGFGAWNSYLSCIVLLSIDTFYIPYIFVVNTSRYFMYVYLDVYVFKYFTVMTHNVFEYFVRIRLFGHVKMFLLHSIYISYYYYFVYASYINFYICCGFLRFPVFLGPVGGRFYTPFPIETRDTVTKSWTI